MTASITHKMFLPVLSTRNPSRGDAGAEMMYTILDDHHTSALTLTGKDCLVRSVSAAHQTLLNIKVLHDVIEEPLCLNGSIKNL